MKDIHVDKAEFSFENRILTGFVEINGKWKRFEVPTEELCYRPIDWDRYQRSIPITIRCLLDGFDAKILEETSERLILSVRKKQLEQLQNNIVIGLVFNSAKVVKLTYRTMFCELYNGIIVTIALKELSAARIGDIWKLFKVGQNVQLSIIDIIQDGVDIKLHGSIKRNYYSFEDVLSNKLITKGDICEVTITDRLNCDGAWVEITPGVPGILNASPEKLDEFQIGDRVYAYVDAWKKGKGFKLHLA